MANRTRSVVWEFFSKGDEANVVKCNICCNILTFFGTTNLLKHLRAKHRDETAEIIQWSTEDGAERTETDVDAQSVRRAKAIEELNESDGTYSPGQQGVRKKRSFAWKCFKKIVGSTLAECLYCGMEMSHWGGSTSALMKHFMVKHPDMYAMHTEAHAEDDDDRNQIGAAKSLNQTQSTEELNESDGMLSLGQKGVRRNRSLAWKCFKKIVGSNVAECLYCGIQLSHVSGATSTLMKHFVVKHSDVYEMHVEGHPKAVSVMAICDLRLALHTVYSTICNTANQYMIVMLLQTNQKLNQLPVTLLPIA